MTEPEPSASSKPTRKIPELTLWGKILTGVVVVLCCGGFFWYSNRDPSTAGQPSTGIDAEIICKDFVRNRLKAPSTAGFSDVDHTGSAPTWTVTGNVDAENSFGAKLRMRFTCVVTDDGDQWLLKSLTGLT